MLSYWWQCDLRYELYISLSFLSSLTRFRQVLLKSPEVVTFYNDDESLTIHIELLRLFSNSLEDVKINTSSKNPAASISVSSSDAGAFQDLPFSQLQILHGWLYTGGVVGRDWDSTFGHDVLNLYLWAHKVGMHSILPEILTAYSDWASFTRAELPEKDLINRIFEELPVNENLRNFMLAWVSREGEKNPPFLMQNNLVGYGNKFLSALLEVKFNMHRKVTEVKKESDGDSQTLVEEALADDDMTDDSDYPSEDEDEDDE